MVNATAPDGTINSGLDKRVAAAFANLARYPEASPYSPSERYPEYPTTWPLADEPNFAYGTVRETLMLLSLDRENYGTAKWNPLRSIIQPGQTVLLKPNFIKESRSDRPEEWLQIITHGSFIRAVADYVWKALEGRGRIVVADGPQTDSDFDLISQRTGIGKIRQFYQDVAGFALEVYDLRNEHWIERDGVYVKREKLAGDPQGTVLTNLGDRSHFASLGPNVKFYGAYYDIEETNRHHRDGCHEYAFCRTPLCADVVVHLPKLKTHKKCGITVNLKGLVGLNGNKNLLPHYVFGAPEEGGDQFPSRGKKHQLENLLVTTSKKFLLKESAIAATLARRFKRLAYGVFGSTAEVVRSGNWYRNDTVWRMALDLNAILTFADSDGVLHDQPQRKFFSVVDGIIAGEGNGPMEADAKPIGLVVAGVSPVLVDATCARLMGFDYRKIALIREAFQGAWRFSPCDYEQIDLRSSRGDLGGELLTDFTRTVFQFRPHFGWVNHIEATGEELACHTAIS